MVKKGGVRQRLIPAVNDAQQEAHAGGRAGGIKRRLASHARDSEAARVDLGSSTRASSVSTCSRASGQTPFSDCMREKWARGKLSSPDVLEFATKARQQGAHSLDKLGGFTANAKNAHKNLVSALGYPVNAPEITWIEVPKAGGVLKPHPIVCPISTFEKLIQAGEKRFEEFVRGTDGGDPFLLEKHASWPLPFL
jgi:hypothetical protein